MHKKKIINCRCGAYIMYMYIKGRLMMVTKKKKRRIMSRKVIWELTLDNQIDIY